MYAVFALLRKNPAYADAKEIASSIDKWTKAMRILEGQLQHSGEYVSGAFSLADISLALSTHRWMSTPFERPSLPAVEAHYARMKQRPAGKKYMGEGTP